jgi:RNA polymerase sigma-70 factor (ECF subfamily)
MATGRRATIEGPDEALLRRCRRGDREALTELLSRHRPLIWSVSRRIAGHGAHLEDIVQDAMVAVIESLDRFRGDARLSTWIASVAARTALNWVNRRPERREAPLGEPSADAGYSPAAEVQARDSAARLQEAIDRLPPEHRAVVCLRHIEGLSVQEVAEALGIPDGTVKSRLHYARRQLRRYVVARLREGEER